MLKDGDDIFVLIDFVEEDHADVGGRDVSDFVVVGVGVLFVGLDAGLFELDGPSELDDFAFIAFENFPMLILCLLDDLFEHEIATGQGVIFLDYSEIGCL